MAKRCVRKWLHKRAKLMTRLRRRHKRARRTLRAHRRCIRKRTVRRCGHSIRRKVWLFCFLFSFILLTSSTFSLPAASVM